MKIKMLAAILILCSVLFTSCESEIPLYRATENMKKEKGHSLNMTLEKYYPEQNQVKDLFINDLGEKNIDPVESQKIVEIVNKWIQYLYNLSYAKTEIEDIEKIYDLTSEELAEIIRNSEYLNNKLSDIKKHNVIFTIPEAAIMSDNRVKIYETDNNILVYAIPIEMIIETTADKDFFKENSLYVNGDTRIALWIYLKFEDNTGYKIIATSESHFVDDSVNTHIMNQNGVFYEEQ